MGFVDYATLKERVRIEQAFPMLNLQMKQHGDQWRGACPICKQGGDRALVVTISKGLFYCFAAQSGGDVIALVAHIKGLKANEAANEIAQHFGRSTVPSNSTVSKERATPPQEQKAGFNPLTYLEAKHEAVQALGLSPETCQTFGAGYAGKGIMRGRLAIPIHDRAGTLLAYCGRTVKNESPVLTFPNGFDPHSVIFNSHQLIDGGDLWVCRDPLQVLQAVENGIPAHSIVAFLTEGISAQQFEQLASLMDEKRCEPAQLF